jgi:hypothetical protein
MDRPTAAVGSYFVVFLNWLLTTGFVAIYQEGLLPNTLGFLLVIVLTARLKKNLSVAYAPLPSLVLSGIILALLILAHPFCSYWWFLSSLLLLGCEIGFSPGAPPSALIRRYLIIIEVGFLLSAYWWLPFVSNLRMNQTLATEPFNNDPLAMVLGRLLSMKNNGGWAMLLFAIAGGVELWRRGDRKTFFLLTGLIALSALLTVNAINAVLPFSSVVSSSQRLRFEGFYYWSVLLLAAHAVPPLWRRGPAMRGVLVALLVAGFFVFPLYHARWLSEPVTSESVADISDLRKTMNDRLTLGEFVFTEDDWSVIPVYGSPHFLQQQLPTASGKTWDVSGGLPEGTRGSRLITPLGQQLGNIPLVNQLRRFLDNHGVRYLVTTTAKSRDALQKTPDHKLIWEGTSPFPDRLALIERSGFQSRFGLPAEASAVLSKVSYAPPGAYELLFGQPVSLPAGTSLAVGFHPFLRVFADGRPISTLPNEDHLLTLREGIDHASTIEIVFTPPFLHRLTGWISLLGWITAIFLLFFKRRS